MADPVIKRGRISVSSNFLHLFFWAYRSGKVAAPGEIIAKEGELRGQEAG